MENGIHATDGTVSVQPSMVTYVEELIQNGAELFVDNRVASTDIETIRAVCEDGSYMADYVVGVDGNVSQVRLDKVVHE